MFAVFRRLALLGAMIALPCGLLALPADAAAATAKSHHVHKKHKKSRGDSKTRTAQIHLANLGYYTGKIDGLYGPKTRAAIKGFQRTHKLKITGTLTATTYNAIIAADKSKAMTSLPMPLHDNAMPPEPGAPPPDFYAAHPDFYGYYNQQYENAGILGFPQNVSSRYAKIDLSENMSGAAKRYTVTVSGQPLLMIDGQPSIIGVSRTYALGEEDVIILTSYQEGNTDCAYTHHLLVLHEGGSSVKDVHNCTRGYQAKVADDFLFITFLESDDNRDVGATWRYEKGDLERL